jgi:hypothetical protein
VMSLHLQTSTIRKSRAFLLSLGQQLGQVRLQVKPISLVFHKALWMGDTMDHSLLSNLNQLRHYSTHVDDNLYGVVQMHLASEDGEMTIPLHSEGTTIYLQ